MNLLKEMHLSNIKAIVSEMINSTIDNFAIKIFFNRAITEYVKVTPKSGNSILKISIAVIVNGENTDMKHRKNDGLKLFNEAILPVPKKAALIRITKIKPCSHSLKFVSLTPEMNTKPVN
ncbi:unnamed protein product [Brugia timori]|uniref:Uncharacterized protein n=1 Tax=Brugia timori TaxID=42155 RepID=A0A0R3QZX3_9BILA|nr:unnamed protein product [Brugia timori]